MANCACAKKVQQAQINDKNSFFIGLNLDMKYNV
jgi:hypothetical protein